MKNVVEFIIWVVKPPMDPRIFEDDIGAARDFVKKRVKMYEEGALTLQKPFEKGSRYDKPPDEKITKGLAFLKTGHEEPYCRNGKWHDTQIADFYATRS